jgi:hypothetical protein
VNEGKLPVDIGIGLNTDNVVSGTIGSKKRMDYTIIGDGVNLAARLESACKQYGAHILISEFTYKALKATYYSRELDLVVVKGKTKPVAIHEILDYHSEESYPKHDGCPAPFQGRPAEVPAAEMERCQGRIQRRARAQRPRQGGEDVHRALRPFHRQSAGRGLERRLGDGFQVISKTAAAVGSNQAADNRLPVSLPFYLV